MNTTLNKVIIPVIRRVMPAIIANSIIGVSPMVGPIRSVSVLRSQYYANWPTQRVHRVAVDVGIYNHFLRLNNRRKTQSDSDFAKAGYWKYIIDLNYQQHHKIVKWCRLQFGNHGFYYNDLTMCWWFTEEEDAVMCKLTWDNDDDT